MIKLQLQVDCCKTKAPFKKIKKIKKRKKRPPRVFIDKKGNPYLKINNKKVKLKNDKKYKKKDIVDAITKQIKIRKKRRAKGKLTKKEKQDNKIDDKALEIYQNRGIPSAPPSSDSEFFSFMRPFVSQSSGVSVAGLAQRTTQEIKEREEKERQDKRRQEDIKIAAEREAKRAEEKAQSLELQQQDINLRREIELQRQQERAQDITLREQERAQGLAETLTQQEAAALLREEEQERKTQLLELQNRLRTERERNIIQFRREQQAVMRGELRAEEATRRQAQRQQEILQLEQQEQVINPTEPQQQAPIQTTPQNINPYLRFMNQYNPFFRSQRQTIIPLPQTEILPEEKKEEPPIIQQPIIQPPEEKKVDDGPPPLEEEPREEEEEEEEEEEVKVTEEYPRFFIDNDISNYAKIKIYKPDDTTVERRRKRKEYKKKIKQLADLYSEDIEDFRKPAYELLTDLIYEIEVDNIPFNELMRQMINMEVLPNEPPFNGYLEEFKAADPEVKYEEEEEEGIIQGVSQVASGKNKYLKYTGDGLANDEIENMMKKFKNNKYKFMGVFPANFDKYLKSKKLPHRFSFIMNLDNDKKRGSHWVSVLVDLKNDLSVEYYDSFGREPSDDFIKRIQKIINILKPNTYLKFKINTVENQDSNTNNCGFFSMKFILDRNSGKSFKHSTGFNNSINGEKSINKFKKQFGYI